MYSKNKDNKTDNKIKNAKQILMKNLLDIKHQIKHSNQCELTSKRKAAILEFIETQIDELNYLNEKYPCTLLEFVQDVDFNQNLLKILSQATGIKALSHYETLIQLVQNKLDEENK